MHLLFNQPGGACFYVTQQHGRRRSQFKELKESIAAGEKRLHLNSFLSLSLFLWATNKFLVRRTRTQNEFAFKFFVCLLRCDGTLGCPLSFLLLHLRRLSHINNKYRSSSKCPSKFVVTLSIIIIF